MMAVVKLNDMKSAAIHIEVDIPLLKIRRDGFPDSHLRMALLYCAPGSITDSLAMSLRTHKQQVKIATLTIYLNDQTSDWLTVLHDAICLAAVNGAFYRLTGDDLFILLKMVITPTELFQGTIVECLLVL